MGKQFRLRLLAVVVLGTLVAALSAAPSALATPSPAAATTHHSLATARTWMVGKRTSGPNTYTRNQWVSITGSHAALNSAGCPTGKYQPDVAVHSNNTIVAGSPAPSETAPASCPSAMGPDGVMHPDSWWNPGSWDWGHILSATWNTLWNKCLSGAASGLVGTASGTTIVNLLARGGKVFVGPYGYAAIAIGGCAVSMSF